MTLANLRKTGLFSNAMNDKLNVYVKLISRLIFTLSVIKNPLENRAQFAFIPTVYQFFIVLQILADALETGNSLPRTLLLILVIVHFKRDFLPL